MIELIDRIIDPPKKFNNYIFTFNNKENHSYESRLERIKLSKGKYKKALYPIMCEIKKNRFQGGTYGFVFNDFKVVALYIPKNKQLKTITFLTKSMRNSEFKVKFKRRITQWQK